MFVLHCLCDHIGILLKRISTGKTWRMARSFFLVVIFMHLLNIFIWLYFSPLVRDQNLNAEHRGGSLDLLYHPKTYGSWWLGHSCYRSWASCQVCISDFSHCVKFQRNKLSFICGLLLICIPMKCLRGRILLQIK